MGKRDKRKDKKKGLGAEKTAKKTDKKAVQKLKKTLETLGETDVKQLISDIKERDRKRTTETTVIVVIVTGPPSRRSNFSLTTNTDKDELILFGGEYFNGSKTEMYNDLFIFNVKKREWSQILCSELPTPRSSHQAVYLSQGGGQLWIFGGEFDSPSQYRYYKDLWVFHLQSKKWEKIASPNGPSSRSGHRMVAIKKRLFVFGGFYDNLRESKYYNDVYMFNTKNYVWTKIEATGIPPSPRSISQMLPLSDGRILLYGGYSREKVKKEVDKGLVHADMFYLQPDKNDESLTKWKWVSVKQSGLKPSPRCGFSMVAIGNDNAILYGGVFGKDEEENSIWELYGDIYQLELDKGKWYPITLAKSGKSADQFNTPKARMNAGLAFKKRQLYLYGGTCEGGEKQLTFSDFYTLDIHKLDSWETLIADDIQKMEYIDESSSSEPESSDDDSSINESKSDEMDCGENLDEYQRNGLRPNKRSNSYDKHLDTIRESLKREVTEEVLTLVMASVRSQLKVAESNMLNVVCSILSGEVSKIVRDKILDFIYSPFNRSSKGKISDLHEDFCYRGLTRCSRMANIKNLK